MTAHTTSDATALYERFGTEPLLLPSEVAQLFRVDPKTVTRWARAGKLPCVTTVGGHRRYRESVVRAYLEQITGQTFEADYSIYAA